MLISRRERREDGFTLIELLITVSLVGMVTVALAGAILGYLKNTDTTTRRLNESHDAQISAAYFAQDVASMGVRSATSPYALLQSVETSTTSTALACGTVGTNVVRFGWDDPTSTTAVSQLRVAYVIQTVGTERQLHRLVCVGGSTTPSQDVVLAHNLDTTAPVVTCATPVACTGVGTAVPQSVSMVLSIKNPSTIGTAYTVTLTGQRRQS
jgi:prepilin-type N-terminal cleavage/methylation domain-containing protein